MKYRIFANRLRPQGVVTVWWDTDKLSSNDFVVVPGTEEPRLAVMVLDMEQTPPRALFGGVFIRSEDGLPDNWVDDRGNLRGSNGRVIFSA